MLLQEPGVDREAVLGEREGRRNNVGEAHGAEADQRLDEGAKGAGDASGKDALGRDRGQAAAAEGLRRGPARGDHVAVDRDDAGRAGLVHEDGAFAADRVHLRVDDALDQDSGDGGIDSIPAGLSDLGAGQGGEGVLGGDGEAAAENPGEDGDGLGRENAEASAGDAGGRF